MAEFDGEFSIERVVTGESDREQEEAATSRKPNGRDSVEVQTTDAASLEAGARRDDAFPASLRRKYYVVAEKQGKEDAARFYADERGEYLAFKLADDRLTTRLTAPEVIRDMIAITEHRDWATLHVHGSTEFRREAWLEANTRGITVKGYEPTALDREALASRRAALQRYAGRQNSRRHSSEGRRPSPDRSRAGDRAVSNVTAMDPAKRRFDQRETAPDYWRSRAARFRNTDRRAAARDAELVGAVSQLVIVEKALERAFPHDPEARERIMDAAKERIADHLEEGRTFNRALVREQSSSWDKNTAERDDARRVREDVRERMRQRER
ncbi:MAG: hypothetical protein FJX45_10915 [Alphaproteobacteria bacterium]|nr:hypothetical protein [Alphaproteobacteria bacterium]MBM3654652.1 hypothetical protein [Alphaproteobacteria bacterium]